MYETKLGVVIGYKEVYGVKGYPLTMLITELQKYDQQAVNNFLSASMLMVTHADTKAIGYNAHLTIMGYLLPEEDIEKAKKYFDEHQDGALQAMLHDQILLTLMKLNFEYNNIGGMGIVDPVERLGFGKIILSMNGIWLDSKTIMPYGREGTRKGVKETLRVLQAVEFLTIGNDPVLNLLVRGNYFIDEMRKNNQIDFTAIFKKSTGIDIENYIDLVFVISLGWTVVDFDKIAQNIYKDTSTYFSNTHIPQDQIDKFINLVSFEGYEYQKLNSTYIKRLNLNRDNLYSQITFLLKPINRNGNILTCINPYFVSNLLTEGAYNIVREAVKGTKDEQTLPNAWGDVFESYIHLILNETFKKKYIDKVQNPDGTDSIDGILELKDSVLLIETKYPHWSYEARVTGRRDAVRSFILKFVRYKQYKDSHRPAQKIRTSKKGFGQLKKFIEDYNSGAFKGKYDFKGKKLIPIVVLGEAFPFDPINMELLMNHIDAQGCLIKQDNAGYPILLSAEEVELIQSLVEAKDVDKFEQVMMSYSKDMDNALKYRIPYFHRPTTFKNAVHREKLAFPNNSYIRKRFDKITNRIKALLQS